MLNKKLEYFVTLSQCLSFTQAAAAHSVSQTAISQYIAALENKLQVRLFNRNAIMTAIPRKNSLPSPSSTAGTSR